MGLEKAKELASDVCVCMCVIWALLEEKRE